MAGHQRHRGDLTPMMVFAIFSAVLGMFQFGFNTGVINAPQKVLEEFIANIYKNRTGNWITEELRDVIWSITVSIFAIGGMLGGLMGAKVADWCGRKTGLVLNNTIAVVGVTLMSSSQLSQSIECLIIGRFFIGLNCGLNTALVPMYLTEISTVNMRGALGTVSQLGVTIGLLFSQVLGLNTILGTKDLWPFLFGFAFVPAVLQLIMLPFCPESPRYLLLSCGRISDARMALRRLRASSDVESDIEEMRAEDRAHHEEVRKYGKLNSIKELFQHPHLRTPMIIGIMMQLSQQLSGINAIFYYSTDIFLSAEVPEDYAVYATMGVGVIMVIMTLISIPLMDRLGRRALHLYGLGGMFLASIFLTISLLVKFLYDWMKYTSVISILLFTVFFGIGPGSIPFMITAELFTQGTRPAAMSVSVLFNWLSNFSVGLAFPLMKRVLQSYLFLPFTVFLAIFWIFTYKKLPETKNRTFEEIAALFKPIQFGTGGSSFGFPDYGSNPGTAGPEFPVGGGDGHQLTPGSPVGTKIVPQDRFRFDPATTGSFINEQQQQQTNCSIHTAVNQVCPEHCTYASTTAMRSEQGNAPFHSHANHNCHSSSSHLPHNSYTSIHTQNLSTNDQQPLIVDVVYNNNNNNTANHHCNQHDHHNHHHNHHYNQHTMIIHDNNCLKHNHSPHSNMTNSSNIAQQQTTTGHNHNNQVNTNSTATRSPADAACCCDLLDTTTSFMATDPCHTVSKLPHQQPSDCFYCRRDSQLASAASKANRTDSLGGRYNEYPPISAKDSTTRDNELYNGQLKSRTLTRTTYEPLNDMYFANQQPHHTRLSNNDQV